VTADRRESRQDEEGSVASCSPVIEVLRTHPKNVLLAAGAVIIIGLGFYLFVTYMLSYGTEVLGCRRARS
jgi:hypothetical protein